MGSCSTKEVEGRRPSRDASLGDADEPGASAASADDLPAAPPAAGALSPDVVRVVRKVYQKRHAPGRSGRNPSLRDAVKKLKEDAIFTLLQGAKSKQELLDDPLNGSALPGSGEREVVLNFFTRLFDVAGVEGPPDLEDTVDACCRDDAPPDGTEQDSAAQATEMAESHRSQSLRASSWTAQVTDLPPRPECAAASLAPPPPGWTPKYVAGASGVDEDVLVCSAKGGRPAVRRNVRWTFDGSAFKVEVEDAGNFYPLMDTAFFRKMRDRATGKDGHSWGKPVYEAERKGGGWVRSWTRKALAEPKKFVELRVSAEFPSLKPSVLYDVLHDAAYRSVWDSNMEVGKTIADLSKETDIGYYQAKIKVPFFDNREFCNQRGWRSLGRDEYLICNFSVVHPEELKGTRKGVTRSWSHGTAYHIERLGKAGCSLSYFSHTDPGGSLPSMLINFLTGKLAPAQMDALASAAADYCKWVEKNWKDSDGGSRQLAGKWDKTSVGQPYFPRDPTRTQPADWDTATRPMAWEEDMSKPLLKRQDEHYRLVLGDEEAARRWIEMARRSTVPVVAPAALESSRRSSRASERQPPPPLPPPPPPPHPMEREHSPVPTTPSHAVHELETAATDSARTSETGSVREHSDSEQLSDDPSRHPAYFHTVARRH